MNKWEDVERLSENKLGYRTILKDSSTKVESLNGLWKFKLLDSPYVGDDDFYKKPFLKWGNIEVPGNWEMFGYGEPRYVNDHLDTVYMPPRVVTFDNKVGLYQRYFSVKSISNDKRYVLRLHGVESAAEIYINGKYAGYDKHARVTGEFDISDLVVKGENRISLKVYQYTDLIYMEDQDMWRLGGIFRDVDLVIENKYGIKDIRVNSNLINNYKDGSLKILMTSDIKTSGVAELYLNEKMIQDVKFQSNLIEFDDIKNVEPWSAEMPTLYKLIIKTDKQVITEFVGFRTIEIYRNIFKVNGVGIKLKGANRHSFSPTHGRYMTDIEIENDIVIAKQNNMNAFRTSHYPSHYKFYELCDKYGIYLIDEADIETQGSAIAGNWQDMAIRPEYTKHFIEKAKQMIFRDKNHPSIILFSLGNESGFGPNFIKMANYIKNEEFGIPIHYEGDDDVLAADIHSSMYTYIDSNDIGDPARFQTFANQANGITDGQKRDIWTKVPHLECEYQITAGNGPGALKDFWDFFYSNNGQMGGFLWQFHDTGLLMEGKKNAPKFGSDFSWRKTKDHNGSDGLITCDRRVTPGLLEYKQVLSPVRVDILDKGIEVTNMLDFIDVSKRYEISYNVIKKDGELIKSGKLDLPKLKRYESKKIKLDFNFESTYILKIDVLLKESSLYAKKGFIVSTNSRLFKVSNLYEDIKLTEGNYKVSEKNDVYLVKGSTLSLEISKSTGAIQNVKHNGATLIKSGLDFSVWKPLIKDYNNLGNEINGNPYNLDVTCQILDEFKFDVAKNCIRFSTKVITGTPNAPWNFIISTNYILTGDSLSVTIAAKYGEGVLWSKQKHWEYQTWTQRTKEDVLPKFLYKKGFDFKIKKSLQEIEYLGDGPNENYPDSSEAGTYWRYNTTVDKLWFNYFAPSENGNHMNVNELELRDEKHKIKFISNTGFNFSAHNYNKYVIDDARSFQDMTRDKYINLYIDHDQNGIGARRCSQPVLKKDRSKLADFAMQYSIIFEVE